MKYLAVIPARGGSKGIPKKNIYPLNGKPLIEYSLDVIRKVTFDCDVAVSSDSDEILSVASKYDGVYLIKRPDEISGDKASSEDALIHAASFMEENYGKKYDAIITLQATSPFRKPKTIDAFIKSFESNPEFDAQLTLSKNTTDFWVQKEDGTFERLYPNAPRRRQERKPLFAEDSCLYVTKTDALFQMHSVLGSKCNGFEIEGSEALDINEPIDLTIAEAMIKSS